MLIVKVLQGENIDRAIKRYRQKIKRTHQIKKLRENQQFTKKSLEKRELLAKAKFKEEYIRKNEQ